MAFNPDQKPDIRELNKCKNTLEILLKEKNIQTPVDFIIINEANSTMHGYARITSSTISLLWS
jgi:hypothetical protein